MAMGTFQIVCLVLILIFVAIRAVVSVMYAQGKYMQDADMKTDEWPDLGPIYVRHFLRLLFKPRAFGPKHRIKKITLAVKKRKSKDLFVTCAKRPVQAGGLTRGS